MKAVFSFLTGVIVVSQFSLQAFALDKKALHGQWGGDGVNLFFTPDGADGGFYCSTGRIDSAVTPDEDGNFCVTGSMDLWTGTPQPPQHLPATFSGHIERGHMHLTVHMPGQQDWIFDADKGIKSPPYACEL